jgi:PBP1b-binding outer membrane lipoprotein LpoB
MEFLPYMVSAVLTLFTGALTKIVAGYSERLKDLEKKTQELEVVNATLTARSSGQTAMMQELKSEVSDIRNNMVRRDDFAAMGQLINDAIRNRS